MVSFNTDPLVAPMGREELRVLKQRRASGEFGKRPFPVLVVVVVIVVGGIILVIGSTMVQGMVAMSKSFPGSNPFGPVLWIFAGVAVVFASVIGLILYASLRSPGGKQWPSLVRFADANGLRFGLVSPSPQYPGLIFDYGRDRQAVNHLYSSTGILADVGSYQYTTGSGKDSQTHTWHFAAFRLPQRVPHLLLDAKANNRKTWGFKFTNLPDSFHSSQRLTLGAPFDDYYELYAPSGYGQDAFYLLPPNVMEALLNAPVVYDIELVDDWLFCYTQSSQDLSDPATWRLFETITNGMVGSLSPVVDRYRDRRMEQLPGAVTPTTPGPVPQVAPQGARLRKGLNKALLVSAGFGVGIFLLRLLFELIFGL